MTATERACRVYLTRGWAVFPIHTPVGQGCSCLNRGCKDQGKHPRTTNGFLGATLDPQKVAEWLAMWPNANLGIATGTTSGFWVLDVDHGTGGDETLFALEVEHGDLPVTPLVHTGGGGRHYLFALPEGREIACRNGIANGIDVKGNGGYVVAAPSLHASGASYRWDADRHPAKIALARAPEWLLELVCKKPLHTRLSGAGGDGEDRIPEGQRNGKLASVAGRLRWTGLDDDEIDGALQVINAKRCDPPLPAAEVASIARSIARYEPNDNVFKAAVNGGVPDERDEDQLDEDEVEPEAGSLEFPTSVLRGTFAAVTELLRPVTAASEAHVFAATWAALATCIGHTRWGEWSGRIVTPTYAILVGPTGDHKSSVMDRVTDLLPDSVRRVDGATSDVGLFDVLEEAAGAGVMLHFDELGFLLKMAGISGQMLDAMLNRLWGAPAKLERRLSKGNKNGGARCVERPHVTMLAGSHVESFWRNLESPDLAIGSGFVNRLAPFCVERRRSLPITRKPDEHAAANIRAHLTALASLEACQVQLSATAEKLWTEYSAEHDRRIDAIGYPKSAIVTRVRDHVARLALVFATDAGRIHVEPSELLGAIEVGAFIEASYEHLLAGRPPGRGPERESGIEATCRRLLAKRPAIGQTVRQLARSWPWQPAPSSREIRRSLSTMGLIRETKGRRDTFRLPGKGPSMTPDTQLRENNGAGRQVSDGGPISHASGDLR